MVTDDHNADCYELQTKKENGQIEITKRKLINAICVNRFIFEELNKEKKDSSYIFWYKYMYIWA